MQEKYGLSRGELRVCKAISKCWPLKDYARTAMISVETARSQLKAAMAKTGTHRQVELMIRMLFDDGGPEEPQLPRLDWKTVCLHYPMSPAESRLTVALAKGWTLKDYAKVTTISVETARSQLKAAMSKTGTYRQVELIRLLLTGPAALSSVGGSTTTHAPVPNSPESEFP